LGIHKHHNVTGKIEAVLKNDLKIQLVTGPAATEVKKFSKSMCTLIPTEALWSLIPPNDPQMWQKMRRKPSASELSSLG